MASQHALKFQLQKPLNNRGHNGGNGFCGKLCRAMIYSGVSDARHVPAEGGVSLPRRPSRQSFKLRFRQTDGQETQIQASIFPLTVIPPSFSPELWPRLGEYCAGVN